MAKQRTSVAASPPTDTVKTNVIGGIITAVLLAGGSAVWAYAPGTWKWFVDALSAIWAHLMAPSRVSTWWLYILYAVGAGALLVVALIVRETLTKTTGPTYLDYKEDRFLGAVWRWQYAGGSPTGAWAFCPACDTMLVYGHQRGFGDVTTTLHCETCKRDVLTEQGDKDYLVNKVYRQIDRNLRTGAWKNYVEHTAEAQT